MLVEATVEHSPFDFLSTVDLVLKRWDGYTLKLALTDQQVQILQEFLKNA